MYFKSLKIWLFFVFALQAKFSVVALNIGSNSTVSLENYTLFPAGEDNKIETFAYLRDGFGLTDMTTSCTFASIFPLQGHLSLHGGTLFLDTDLDLNNKTVFASGGTIKGNQHMFSLCQSVTALPTSHPLILENVALYLYHDLTISHTIVIRGDCSIYGGDNNINLEENGALVVDHNAQLLLSSVELHGVKNYNLRCVNNSGSLILDHTRLVQTGDYTFTQGSILFRDDTQFVGPFIFDYDSLLTSTIDTDSSFYVADLAKLSFGNQRGRSPLYFVDKSSMLKVENAVLAIKHEGFSMTRGTFLGSREVILEINSPTINQAFSMGNGRAEDDALMKLLPASVLKHTKGHFIYDIVSVPNFFTGGTAMVFERYPGTTFWIKQSISFDTIYSKIVGSPLTTIINPGINLTHKNARFDTPFFSYTLTGSRPTAGIDLLDHDDGIEIHAGSYQFGLISLGRNNKIKGSGSIQGAISLTNPAAQVSFSFDGPILKSIVNNGGTIFCDRDLLLGNNAIIAGRSCILLQKNKLSFDGLDIHYNGSVNWTGAGGTVELLADIALSSAWSFTGNCILQGNACELKFLPTGKITVGSNSTLHIKNSYLSQVHTAALQLTDHSSRIIFDDTQLTLNDTMTLTSGSFEVRNHVEFLGSSTLIYSSPLTSTITKNSQLTLSRGIRFITGRSKLIEGREPLFFEDRSSIINFDDATLVITSSGVRFTRGTGIVNKQLHVEMNSTSSQNGIIFGNNRSEDDFFLRINPGASWYLPTGDLGYEVTNPYGIYAVTTLASIYSNEKATIHLDQNVILKNLSVVFSGPLLTKFNNNVYLRYENCNFVAPGLQFTLSGQRYNDYSNLLNNGSLFIETGMLPLVTIVSGNSNIISGLGGISQPIILNSPTTQLQLSLDSIVQAPIILNKSILTLGKSLTMGDNKTINGQGIVNLDGNTLEIGGLALSATSSLDIISSKGSLKLRDNLQLTSRWTFSGECTIQGNGNTLIFASHGQIALAPGSRLIFKNIKLDGLRDEKLFCRDNSGVFVFDSTICSLDSNMSFTLGAFKIINESKISGQNATFSYESSMTSTITDRSKLIVSADTRFSYDPPTDQRKLIVLENNNAHLTLENAELHTTATGIQLTKGQIEIFGQCRLSADGLSPAEGIIFGDGALERNDIQLDIYPDSVLEIINGYLVNKNIVS